MLEVTILLFCFVSVLGLEERIFGGEETHVALYPSIVSLRTEDDSHGCAGVLLDNYTVISVAQCFGSGLLLTAVYGSDTLSECAFESEFAAIDIHPNYEHPYKGNDIAVITLKTPVTLLGTATFPKIRTTDMKDGEKCTFLGWGRYEKPFDSSPLSDHLKLVNLYSISCRGKISRQYNLAPGYLCMVGGGYKDENKTKIDSACRGDAGGPLYCEDGLTAVESYGPRDCGEKRATIFVDLRFFKSWIEQIVEKNKNLRKNGKVSGKVRVEI